MNFFKKLSCKHDWKCWWSEKESYYRTTVGVECKKCGKTKRSFNLWESCMISDMYKAAEKYGPSYATKEEIDHELIMRGWK